MTGVQHAGEPFRVAQGDAVVTAQKVYTGKGERLELRAETLGSSVRLDAIALESVTWQEPDELADRAADLDRSDATPASSSANEREEPMTVSSEYALAELRTVPDSDGTELEIRAPKLGHSVRLGPRELEWLTTRTHETFSEWLETPFGPDADDHDHSH